MDRRRQILILLAVLALGAVGVAVAGVTGKISGRVTDGKGAPLPGASVVMEGTRRGAVSDAEGYYVIVSVDPGAYRLKASLIGHDAESKTDVKVATDYTTTVNFQLRETAVEMKEIVVQAERPLVEPDRTESRYVVTAKDIEQVPIIRSTAGFVELEAGVSVDGSLRIRNAAVQDAGSSVSGGGEVTEYVVDGIKLTTQDGRRSGGRGTASSQNWTGNVNPSAVSEITVLAGGLNAEYGAQGGAVSLVTQDGGRDFHGQVHYRYSPPTQLHWGKNFYESPSHQDRVKYGDATWVGETDAAGRRVHERPSTDYTDEIGHFLEAMLSGPIGRSVSFMVSTQHDLQPYTFPRSEGRTPFNANTTYKLTFDVTPTLKMRVGGLYSYGKGRFGGVGVDRTGDNGRAIFLPEGVAAAGFWKNRDMLNYLSVTHSISPRTFYELKVSRIFSKQDTAGVPAVTTAPNRDKAGWFYTTPGTVRDYYAGEQTRYNIKGDISSQVTRGHFLKAGFDFTRFNSWIMSYGETAGGLNRSLVYWGDHARIGKGVTPYELQAYIQDKMEFEGMVVNAGFRYERFGGQDVPLYPYQSWTTSDTFTRRVRAPYTKMKALNWFMPRIGISHPISSRSKLHFFYGKFHTRPDFRWMFGEIWTVTGAPSKDLNKDGKLSPEEENNALNLSDGYGGINGIQIPSLQHAQVSTSFETGVEWNFISDYTAQVTAYYRVSNGFIGLVNMRFVDPTLPGTGQSVRSYGPRRQQTTRGIEMSLKKAFLHNFSFRASIDLGWGDNLTWAGTKSGETSFYPDSMYIADPNRYWQRWKIDATTGAEIPDPPTVDEVKRLGNLAQNRIRQGLAGQFGLGSTWRSDFYKVWERPGLTAEERRLTEGLYAITTTIWGVEGGRPDVRLLNGSLVLIYSSPPDFGPGKKFLGSTFFGDIRANLIYRIYSGRIFDFINPKNNLTEKRTGPTTYRTDFSVQKGFDINGFKPLLYLEINNLFNAKVPNMQSQGTGIGGEGEWLRYGLIGPYPNDVTYKTYGDINDYRRYTGNPRQVYAGVRFSW